MRKHGGVHTWKCVRKCIGITNNTGAFFVDAELSSWLACQPHKLDVTGSSPVSAIIHLLSRRNL